MKKRIGSAGFTLGFSMLFLGGAFVETAIGLSMVVAGLAFMLASGLYLDNI